ncbi:TonB-dependent receptor [Oleiagrimonas sp. C23AA]|uniref:TonB-dependent receptor n=1 Tax=Oleiagrimonas sp. C23AA TaxID=2719047 RepID=UPI001423986C|nr:TonB-dependent receptor [Oleiagrimonas sp. C23AA]NII11216.1 TonB-dependent receptor [Oleiagrimonas sp. C23AA]
MNSFKRSLLATAIATACFGMYSVSAVAAGAHGQDTATQSTSQDQAGNKTDAAKKKTRRNDQAQKLQAVEVSGYVSSLENAINIKRNASTIVEAVSAEQIGKLPGVSIADTLGRLPGLAVQTVSGRPQVLTIHGLGPDFSTALVNGGQQVSTSNNRDVQFDQYPSSWFDNVEVHLSPEASLVGQGLAGTVDMHTIRPLEKDKPEAAINAHYIWDGMSQLADGPGVGDKGYHVNGIWVNQFADHTFGVTVGVDFESNPSQIQHQAPWGYASTSDGGMVIGGSKNYGISDQMNRNGFLTTLQWKPNDFFTSTLDLTYDKFKETQQAKGMELPLGYGPDGTSYLTSNQVDADGFVESGTYDHVKAVVRNDYNKTNAKVWNINWENDFHFNENWSGNLTASYSRAQRSDLQLESYSGTGYGTGADAGAFDTIGFTERGNGLLYVNPSLDYSNAVLTDPQGWGAGGTPAVVQAGFINAPHTDDYLANLKASIKREFVDGPISSVEAGVVRGTRKKTYSIDQTFLTLGGGYFTDGNTPVLTAPTGGGTCDPLAWMGVGAQPCYNPLDLIANGTYTQLPTALSSIAVPPNWKVTERDVTSYLQFNIDTTLGSVGLRGNVGIQVAHTNQTSDGQRVTAGDGSSTAGDATAILVPVSGGTKYTRYLPSANLIFSFSQNDDLRIGAARVMARPRMDQMSASLGVSGNITHLTETDPNLSYFSASGGNAELLPTMADNYNVSYEHYFGGDNGGYQCNNNDAKQSALCQSGGQGYFALSAYYLKLSDYIDPNAAYLYDFSAFVNSYLTPDQQAQLGTTKGIVSGPVNDGHGYVKGAQATVNLPLGDLTPSLSGFGVILTGNYTKSSLVYGDNPDPITVPGLSKWVANGTLYYQNHGFEARVSDSYRDDFLGRVSGISATRIEQTIKGGSTYDAQVSYTFDSGALKGLTVIAQGSNLSNKTFQTIQNNDSRQVLTWERYGRRYDVGISYKFW